MPKDVELHSDAMKLEAGELTYNEGVDTIWLMPWARLTRRRSHQENSVIESGNAVVTLKDGAIRLVEAQKAKGIDTYPERRLEYSADQLAVSYTPAGEVEKVIGDGNARLVSSSSSSLTTMTADRVDLAFAAANGESTLEKALANGKGFVESKPLPTAGVRVADTRVLSSESIELNMRPGGKEIETVVTHSPGELLFLPNRAGERRRKLNGERMWITYGADNRIESCRSVQVVTETEPSAEERARNRSVALTRSQNLTAAFDPRTGELARMEQWDNFIYKEGDRTATANRAVLESSRNLITLEPNAKVADSGGWTSADRIQMDQESGSFTATGQVVSSRLPDKKAASDLFAAGEPLQATAQKMTTSERNRRVRYEGNAVLWQGGSRITADEVEIDREKRGLTAVGKVVTQLLETGKKTTGFTIVKADKLVYTEQDRLANYSGGVLLNRTGLQVKAAQLRAYLAESSAESRIEKAYADGSVEIVQTANRRVRKGLGEHAEYHTAEEKILIRGGDPQLIDSERGLAKGTELTYFANDDRLLVTGAPGKPATSRIRKK